MTSSVADMDADSEFMVGMSMDMSYEHEVRKLVSLGKTKGEKVIAIYHFHSTWWTTQPQCNINMCRKIPNDFKWASPISGNVLRAAKMQLSLIG